ncbi:MAG: hypothetical protein QMD11_06555 [Smithella sp.]|nr:hypothetical protein [Smithella sp.]
MKRIWLALLAMIGCQTENVSSVKWDTGVPGEKMQTMYERVDMRNKSARDAVFKKYDGWKLIYISEYTTGNKLGTDGAVCFERVIK